MNDATSRSPSSKGKLIVLAVVCLLVFSGFVGLGLWQLHRLSWKHDLIARVDARIHAPPISPPAPSDWSQVDAAHDEYRRVLLHGHYLADRDTRVQALTELGSGFWVLSPFQLEDGSVVLVNRGFIAADFHNTLPSDTASTVIGLLRLSEPGGGFLRHNIPAQNRWYSRDVTAIAAARGLQNVAPFFVDAEVDTSTPTWPRAGLTVTHFQDNHLGYALTWFALALMVAGAGGRLAWEEFREHRFHSR